MTILITFSLTFLAPANWGKLKEEWGVADSGKRQSPINISTSSVTISEQLPHLKYNRQNDANVKLVNNGKFYFRIWLSAKSLNIQGAETRVYNTSDLNFNLSLSE